jgi:spermidine dehydrogenase
MNRKKKLTKQQEQMLGMDRSITRRDFMNAVLIGTGATLLDLPSPLELFAESQKPSTNQFDGYGGTGDYASAHGNMDATQSVAHEYIGKSDKAPENAIDTGEMYDLVVIGGGLSGLGAAFEFKNNFSRKRKCLVLENHDIFGGHAKRNEFDVKGYKLYGPQASNSFEALTKPSRPGYDLYSSIRIPRRFKYQEVSKDLKHIQFDKTNYAFMLWYDDPSIGYFAGDLLDKIPQDPKKLWIADQWGRNLKDVPLPDAIKKDFIRWRTSQKQQHTEGDYVRWLDSMTYKDFIEKVMGLHPRITRFADPILASAIGLGCDAISAYAAYQIDLPGFTNFKVLKTLAESDWHSFPGGNDGITRHLVKALIPEAINGKKSFEHIMNNRVNFDSLDRQGNKTSIRLGATAVWIEHDGQPERSKFVWIYYRKKGKLYRLKAKRVVVSSGGWVARNIVKGMPQEYDNAYRQFHRAPIMVVNVALTNWKFLFNLGFTACQWRGRGDFGFSCNIKLPMEVGAANQPPLHPDYPAVLTFYIPYFYPGKPLEEQGSEGRAEMLDTSYYDYEVKLRRQMVKLFSGAGFDPGRDIAGIIFNRWGHAYLTPQPGFYFGRNGQPALRDIIKKRFGRCAFGHSEANGHQNWVSAVEEGARAVREVFSLKKMMRVEY